MQPALEAELDALYGAPLAEFVERRDALAKRLKAVGDAEGSRRIKALRKPTAVAWAINRLHLESAGPSPPKQGERARSGELSAGLAPLRAASAALRGVLRESRSAEERRAAIEARRRALESVTGAVVALLEYSATTVSPALQRRIEGTLLALAAGGGGPDAPVPGRLDQELEPPGFDAIQDFPAPTLPPRAAAGGTAVKEAAPRPSSQTASRRSPPSRPGPKSGQGGAPAGSSRTPKASSPSTSRAAASPAAQRPYVPTRDRKREAAIAAAQRAVDDSEAALERATTKAETARARAAEAEQALERARREVEAARRELVAARTALSDRRRDLDRARRG